MTPENAFQITQDWNNQTLIYLGLRAAENLDQSDWKGYISEMKSALDVLQEYMDKQIKAEGNYQKYFDHEKH